MCGIAGIISADASERSVQRLSKMTDTLVHRGPEGEGFWLDRHVSFGHRRLSIIDLTDGGAQPMHYLNRYTIVYNGEIYNHEDLRIYLQKKGYQFQSASDTEVLLATYACYKENCLKYLDGMFAFAIWDKEEQLLFAARDRFGEKPFYYHYANETQALYFASEINALFSLGIHNDYDGSRLLNYLGAGYTEHPLQDENTFYKHINTLPPAHYLELRPGGAPVIKRWWSLNKEQVEMNERDAHERFVHLLGESVSRRLVSDVPVGTSLSGGLDSSAIVAAVTRFNSKMYSRKSFSAVFPGYVKDESDYVRLVSEQYQLQSYFSTPDGSKLAEDFHLFMKYHQEPVSTASVYAQYKVYQLAKEQQITVLLDGQGADEVLAGYSKYIRWYIQERWRRNAAGLMKEIHALKRNNLPFTWSNRNLVASYFPSFTANQLSKKALHTVLHHPDLNKDFIAAHLDESSFYKPEVRKLNDLLHFNTTQFGLPELLRYADRNSMAHSREVRLPFLNHELVEFIFSLPTACKIQSGWTKWLLRKSTEHVLPDKIVWRREKIGFEPPQESWMKHPQIHELVNQNKKKLVDFNILKPSTLDKKNQSPQVVATEQNWRFLVAGTLLT